MNQRPRNAAQTPSPCPLAATPAEARKLAET